MTAEESRAVLTLNGMIQTLRAEGHLVCDHYGCAQDRQLRSNPSGYCREAKGLDDQLDVVQRLANA